MEDLEYAIRISIKDLEYAIFGFDYDELKDNETKTFAPPGNIDAANHFINSLRNAEYPGYYGSDSNNESNGSGINQKGKGNEGLKILTKQQMFSRLPILLAQIQAGNNLKKLKNEIRQILYSLYRSKALTKTVYNNLIKII